MATFRRYHYVGPAEIRQRSTGAAGVVIDGMDTLRDWQGTTRQVADGDGVIWATFVVDVDGWLRLADRRSEHVACAGGGDVFSAGEIGLVRTGSMIEVAEVSNQSTGYCPEPESWQAVAAALSRVSLPHPGRFTRSCEFRRCPSCGQINLVKDAWFVCGVCDADLPAAWNFG